LGKSFHLKLDPKAPLKDPKHYTIVGKPLRSRTCFSSLELCGECELANLIKKDSQARRRLLLRGTASWPACCGLLGGPARQASWVDVLRCPCLCAPVYWTFVGHRPRACI
jgi:hypothetical protein